MGFMTFQRFNGDALNEGAGWTEGFPIDYQTFKGDLSNKNHPATTISLLEESTGNLLNLKWEHIVGICLTKLWRLQDRGDKPFFFELAPYGTGNEGMFLTGTGKW